MIIFLIDSKTLKLCILPISTVNKLLQTFQSSFENLDKDKFTWLVSEGCKNEKITECQNWAFKLKSEDMSAMQKSLIEGTCISWFSKIYVSKLYNTKFFIVMIGSILAYRLS